jgi:hypothetical protein
MAQGDLGTQLVEARRLFLLGALGLLPVCSGLMWPSWSMWWSIQRAVTVGRQPSPTVEQACLLPVEPEFVVSRHQLELLSLA